MNIFDSNIQPPQGERATEKVHRKIELQSPADLTYLIANVSRAAREKIDKHLPPDAAPEGEDAMRKRVEQLVDEYIRNTFNAAKDGMSINGMDSGEMEAELAKAQEGEEFEPFDSKLAQRIQGLYAQIESQTLQLADLRRQAPAQTAQKFREAYTALSEAEEALLRREEEERVAEAGKIEVDFGGLERAGEVRETWGKGMEGLGGLKGEMEGTVKKVGRAQKAVGYVEGR